MNAASLVRLATLADASAIAAIYAPFVRASHVSFEEVAPDEGEMRARLAAAAGIWPWIVCERAGTIAGFVYAGPHRTRAGYRYSVDTSAYVHEAYRRTGVARIAYTALFAVLARQAYYNAFAGIALPNDASIALHERLGFRAIARYENVGFKAGAWRDTLWLERPLRALETPPYEPRPLRDLTASELAEALGS